MDTVIDWLRWLEAFATAHKDLLEFLIAVTVIVGGIFETLRRFGGRLWKPRPADTMPSDETAAERTTSPRAVDALGLATVAASLTEPTPEAWRGAVDAAPPSEQDWRKLTQWLFTRVKALDLGLGSDTVLIDLDVEIERAGGLRRSLHSLGKRWRRGPRVQQVIDAMLKASARQPLLLEGEPGAGKSVALAQLAQAGLAPDRKARRDQAPIPLYINLNRLPAPPAGEPIGAQHILDYVLRTGAGLAGAEQGTGAAGLFDRCLRWGLRQGRFRILFDSFDEIPALLAAADSGQAARAHGLAIQAFAANPDLAECQTVVASRPYRSPDTLNWPKIALKPLDERRIREAVDARFKPKGLADRVFQELADRWELFGELLANPLFLDLVCRYRKRNDRPPESMGAAFEDFIRRRLTADADRLDGLGLSAELVERGACEIAFRMTADPALGLEPPLDSLLDALRQAGWPLAAPPERIIDILTEVHLAKVQHQDGGARLRLGPHRRFQEFFATRAVLADPTRVDLDDLLWADAWRDTTVTLLETASPPAQRPIHERLCAITGAWADDQGFPPKLEGVPITRLEPAELVEAIERTAQDPRPAPFAWPDRSLHLLGILHNANVRGAADDPVLGRQVDRLLLRAFQSGQRMHQKTALEVAHAGTRDGALWLLKAAFGTNSGLLADVALVQAKLMQPLPDELVPEIRQSLAAQWAVGALDPKSTDLLRRRLTLLDPGNTLRQALDLLDAIRGISRFLCPNLLLAWLIFLYLFTLDEISRSPQVNGSYVYFLWFFGCQSLFLPIGISVLLERRPAGAIAHACMNRSRVDCVWETRILPSIVFRTLALAMIAAQLPFPTGPWSLRDESMAIRFEQIWRVVSDYGEFGIATVFLWLVWGSVAPFAVLNGSFLKRWQWPFIVLLPIIRFPSWIGDLARALWVTVRTSATQGKVYFGSLLVLLWIFFGLIGNSQEILGEERLSHSSLGYALMLLFPYILISLVGALVGLVSLMLFKAGSGKVDLLRLLKRHARSTRSAYTFIARLRAVRKAKRLAATQWTERILTETTAAIARDTDAANRFGWRKPEPDPSWDPAVQAWYRKRARRGIGVAFLDGPVLDELLLLLDDVQKALRYPTMS